MKPSSVETDSCCWFWHSAQVCAATKVKQSGCLCSAAPSQSATVNWLLWEACTSTRTLTPDAETNANTTSKDLPAICWGLTRTGASPLLLSLLSAPEVFEEQQPAVFDHHHRVVSCGCHLKNLQFMNVFLLKLPLLCSGPAPSLSLCCSPPGGWLKMHF